MVSITKKNENRNNLQGKTQENLQKGWEWGEKRQGKFSSVFCASKTPKGNFLWGWFSTRSGCGTINPLEIIRRKPTKQEEST